MKWIVKEIHGAYYKLLAEDLSMEQLAVLRGRHRLDRDPHPSGIPYRNPLCVGDRVDISGGGGSEPTGTPSQAVIETLDPRRNVLFRSSPYEIHKLGSNIDRCIAVASLKTPPLRTGFLDRFLLACRETGIPAGIFFTKLDLIDPENEEDRLLLDRADYYARSGIPCYFDSLLEPPADLHESKRPGLREFLAALNKDAILLTGQSGTGKSTLTNRLLERESRRTSHTSASTGKGRHTTTSSELSVLPGGGFLIDTPGIKEWGLAHMNHQTILENTFELSPALGRCRFRACQHTPETEGCALQELLRSGALPDFREKTLKLILEERHERIRPGDYKKPTGRLRQRE